MFKEPEPGKNLKSFPSPFVLGEGNYIRVVNGGPNQHFIQIHQLTKLGLTDTMFVELTDETAVLFMENILLSIKSSQDKSAALAQ